MDFTFLCTYLFIYLLIYDRVVLGCFFLFIGSVRAVLFPGGSRDFLLLQNVQTGPGAYSASYSVVTRGSFSGVKQPDFEADSSF
jgi:hypothetical protein